VHPLAALLVLAAVALAAPAAEARSLTIETGKYGVRKLGPLDTRSTPSYSPTVAAARRALGRPSNVFPNGGSGCVGKWRRLGLRIVFADFGGGTGPVCGRAKAQSFTIHRSRTWRTWKGLRIGMAQAELQRRHPRARWVDDDEFYADGWWLRSSISPFGGGARTPVLAATVRGADPRVSSFYGWIGAAGE